MSTMSNPGDSNPGDSNPPRLRLITYLVPSIPIGYFELLKEYLEEKLQCYVYLITETRWSGPPKDRIDPFTTGDADIGFACAPNCQRLVAMPSSKAALLGVAPVGLHSCNGGRPVYFTELVVHKDNCERYQLLEDLRGSSWAYNDDHSLSGFQIIHKELQRRGENMDFFSEIIHSGSHLNSIQMILDKTIDCSGIDSNVLAWEMKTHPELRNKLHVVTSFGPMPAYPGLVNSQLPENLKKSIAMHLLNMHQESGWGARLRGHLVEKFVAITMDHFAEEEEKGSGE